jgi:hypothetical protein
MFGSGHKQKLHPPFDDQGSVSWRLSHCKGTSLPAVACWNEKLEHLLLWRSFFWGEVSAEYIQWERDERGGVEARVMQRHAADCSLSRPLEEEVRFRASSLTARQRHVFCHCDGKAKCILKTKQEISSKVSIRTLPLYYARSSRWLLLMSFSLPALSLLPLLLLLLLLRRQGEPFQIQI